MNMDNALMQTLLTGLTTVLTVGSLAWLAIRTALSKVESGKVKWMFSIAFCSTIILAFHYTQDSYFGPGIKGWVEAGVFALLGGMLAPMAQAHILPSIAQKFPSLSWMAGEEAKKAAGGKKK